MASESQTHRGIAHGRLIEVDQDLGLPDGQEVVITVRTAVDARKRLPAGEGIQRSAGGWGDDLEGLDDFLAWSRGQRKQSRPEVTS